MMESSNNLTELSNSPVNYEEERDVPSQNHSLIQARLGGLFNLDDRFNAATELTLDVSQVDLTPFKIKATSELEPDISVYYASEFDIIDPTEDLDVFKVSQMPLLAIEVLSPTQGTAEVFTQFRAYFALGIKSCWLVDPTLRTITVCSSPKELTIYKLADGEVVDHVLDIRLDLNKVFAKKQVITASVG
jgi:Uma2 family endonuclease